MNGEAMEKNALCPRTSPDYLATWAARRAERGDDVVAPGYAGAWAARRASPTAEAVGLRLR